MALNKEDRITMSKKIVTIPDDNAVVESVKLQILAQQKVAIENDNVNMALQEPYNQKINSYQPEYNLIDGKKRTVLTEKLINAAAKGENRNGFFLADPEFPIPSIPDGVWKFFSPMSFCYAIGKKNNEQYDVEPLGEIPTLNVIKSLITQIEGFIDATRASGKKCVQEEICINGVGETSQECIADGGTWVLEDVVVDSPEIQSKLNNLKSKIKTWINSLNGQKSNIQISDLDVAARQAENQAAYDYIDPLLSILKTWQQIQDFDTETNLPNLCEEFEKAGYGDEYCSIPIYQTEPVCTFNGGFWYSSFKDSKLSPTQISILKKAIEERESFLNERKRQLNRYFGEVIQNKETGEIIKTTGWYGQRFLIIDSRLNLISGSANGKFGAEKGIQTQNQIKSSNETAAAAYDLSMKATKAVAPGLDTQYLNVLDASAFKVGDKVYVTANNQEELSGTILEKDGNRVKLSFAVPKKYNLANLTRLYKLVNDPI
jgi:hypothetical protein